MERLTVAKKYDVQWGRNNVIGSEEFEEKILPILRDINPWGWGDEDAKEIGKDDWLAIIVKLREKKEYELAKVMQAYYDEADKHDGWIHFEWI